MLLRRAMPDDTPPDASHDYAAAADGRHYLPPLPLRCRSIFAMPMLAAIYYAAFYTFDDILSPPLTDAAPRRYAMLMMPRALPLIASRCFDAFD